MDITPQVTPGVQPPVGFDCIVVGGGAAGLSAALVLGRARQRTLVIDAGEQSNRVADGIGGLLGHDGRAPDELYAMGRCELAKYPTVEHRVGQVVEGRRDAACFTLQLADGSIETAHRVLLATGMEYRYPDVRGLSERWGRSVFHCPFCHGWEVRDGDLGVLDGGTTGVMRALLLREWSDKVTLYTGGPVTLEAGDVDRLRAAKVEVDQRPVRELRGPDDGLSEIVFTDGSTTRCDALLVAVTLHQRSQLAVQLGAQVCGPGPLAADALVVDAMQQCTVAGVSGAGDVCSAMPSVAGAIASGSFAAAMIVHSLVTEAHGLAPRP